MKDEVLEFLRENAGGFVSGQDMSEACQVSRTAIWKHIKALRQKGYKIESYTKLGYRLLEEPDLVSPLSMRKALTTDVFGKNYIYLDSTTSTNTEARKRALKDVEEGTVVVAEEQVGGRGRLGRGWYSPFGKGLWFSLILRPDFLPMEAPKCTLMAAVAVTNALRKMVIEGAAIKWPNDILVNGKKMVGILTEMSGTMEEIEYIILGIGINITMAANEWPEDLASIGTSALMEGVEIPRIEAFNMVLHELEEQYFEVLSNGFDETLEEWRQLSCTLGQEVTVHPGQGPSYEGLAQDIDQDGNLLIRRQDTGAVERLIAGAVSIRPAGEADK